MHAAEEMLRGDTIGEFYDCEANYSIGCSARNICALFGGAKPSGGTVLHLQQS